MSEIIEYILPRYQFMEHHSIKVRANINEVFTEVIEMDLTDSLIARILMSLWRVPARIFVKDLPDRHMSVSDFIILVKNQPKELVRGLIGGHKYRKDNYNYKLESFRDFQESGSTKLVWAFWLTEESDNYVRVDTQTRVFCTDSRTKYKFSIYWWIIRPWSGLIRMRLLASIKRKAELRVSKF